MRYNGQDVWSPAHSQHCMAGRGHKRMTSLYVYTILKVNILYDNVAVERVKMHKEGL